MPQVAGAALAKSRRSRGDQALLGSAVFACDQCVTFEGLSVNEQANMKRARDYLHNAGAVPAPLWTAGKIEDDNPSLAWPGCTVSDSPEVNTMKGLCVVAP